MFVFNFYNNPYVFKTNISNIHFLKLLSCDDLLNGSSIELSYV